MSAKNEKTSTLPPAREVEYVKSRMQCEQITGVEGFVTPAQYGRAVAELVKLARQDTGGSRVAAQVLLSAYNGYDFQLDITDLGNLDLGNYRLALTVIRGRRECGREPHELIENGGRIFEDLYRRWSRLHVKERGKVDCPRCDGRGRIFLNVRDEDDDSSTPCQYCQGSGRVCRCKRQ